jgi:hypothetical protein
MSNERNQFWNQRYGNAEYVYGEDPNKFLASQIKVLKPGKIIFPCEGEGRNAVFAAFLGWQVAAFDGSAVGQFKALQLAAKKRGCLNSMSQPLLIRIPYG